MSESTKLLICPACGAPLDPQPGEATVKCDYCGNSTILPHDLRASGSQGTFATSGTGFDMKNMFGQAERMKEVVELVQNGRKIDAIKLFRELTGVGLKEAKDAVEAIQAGKPFALDMGSRVSGTPGSLSPAVGNLGRWIGCGVVLLVVGILASVLIPVSTIPFIAAFSSSKELPPVISTVVLPEASPTPAFANLVLSFGEQGQGAGMFNDPRSIGVDQSGNIYVGDYEDGRVQVFDSQGNFLRLINIGDTYLQGLAVRPDGTLYLSYDGEIWIYDGNTGKQVGKIARSDQQYFESIALGADGSLVTASRGEDILRFGGDGNLDMEIPAAISSITGDSELNTLVAVDGLGNIYALGTFNEAVFIFNPAGDFKDRFGGESEGPVSGQDPGHFQAPDTITVDGYGRVFVSDIWGIQVFDSQGQYLDSIDIEGVAFGMAVDLKNDLYIASNAKKVLIYRLPGP